MLKIHAWVARPGGRLTVFGHAGPAGTPEADLGHFCTGIDAEVSKIAEAAPCPGLARAPQVRY
jgi:hypothetical protein